MLTLKVLPPGFVGSDWGFEETGANDVPKSVSTGAAAHGKNLCEQQLETS